MSPFDWLRLLDGSLCAELTLFLDWALLGLQFLSREPALEKYWPPTLARLLFLFSYSFLAKYWTLLQLPMLIFLLEAFLLSRESLCLFRFL